MADAIALALSGGAHAAEAIEAVLRQTDRDFMLVLSGDDELGARYAALDERVTTGSGEGARVRLTDELVVHPEWLEALRAAGPRSYPRTLLVSASGADLGAPHVVEPEHAFGDEVEVPRLLVRRFVPQRPPARRSWWRR